jgi:uroporphyrinogen decarboxylase
MTPREKVNAIFRRRGTGEGAMWTGYPQDETVEIYAREWGIAAEREAIYSYLNDDCRFIQADRSYRPPNGVWLFDPSPGKARTSLSAEGCFAGAETAADIEDYPWPSVDDLDFTDVYAEIDKFPDKMVFTGFWCHFFHIVSDFFGMENYFIKMYENPEIVEAVTERVVDFYVTANDMFLAGLGDRADAIFMGNDFGTQRDLLISPENFRKFVLPSYKKLINVGKKYGKIVMLHSCGSVYRVIPDLIDAGMDVLHPLQAQAVGMDAESLEQFKNDLAFLGGIDAQSFFVNASPDEVTREVGRVRGILGPNIVVSPSHEAILPNVPAANILAMSKAAKERGVKK